MDNNSTKEQKKKKKQSKATNGLGLQHCELVCFLFDDNQQGRMEDFLFAWIAIFDTFKICATVLFVVISKRKEISVGYA